MTSTIGTRLHDVRTRLQRACKRAQRTSDEVLLLAISKYKPAALLQEAWQHRQRCFGENYVQEWQKKRNELKHLDDLQWHITGPLQRNKCKYVAGQVALIHTAHSSQLLQELDKRTPPTQTQDVLLQVNQANEDTKSGWHDYDDLKDALTNSWERLRIRGLMTLPPFLSEPEKLRPYFQELRDWRDRLQRETGHELPHLSMGMSNDMEVAIEEGATIVRVGTAIFGAR